MQHSMKCTKGTRGIKSDHLYGIKIWTDLSSVLSQSTRLTNGRTGRRT